MLVVGSRLARVDLHSDRKEIVRDRSVGLVLDQGTFKSYSILFTKGGESCQRQAVVPWNRRRESELQQFP